MIMLEHWWFRYHIGMGAMWPYNDLVWSIPQEPSWTNLTLSRSNLMWPCKNLARSSENLVWTSCHVAWTLCEPELYAVLFCKTWCVPELSPC